jgi:cytochrome c peroxidase
LIDILGQENQMRAKLRFAPTHLSFMSVLKLSLGGAALLGLFEGLPQLASAEHVVDETESLDWAPPAIRHAQDMKVYKDTDSGSDSPPNVIRRLEIDADPTGRVGTYQPGDPTFTSGNAFFQSLGTNGRSCFTCHRPENGWTVSAASVRQRFAASSGGDPIFRLVDGATCPTAKVKTIGDKQQAYKLLIDKGLIRIGLPMPANAQFEVTKVDDPYRCTTKPATGLTSKTSGIVSVYRRPLPSTNLGFLTTIMWDGREPSLENQSIDATLGHAQAEQPPTSSQQGQIVDFETGIFTAQIFDNQAHDLHADGANGGPLALPQQLAEFFVGTNDPVGLNPTGAPFDPDIFDLYTSPMWQGLQDRDGDHEGVAADRRSIARGERVFNTTPISITGVAGLNDVLATPSIAGFCGTCHDTPDVGNHSVRAPLNIGVANAGANSPPGLDISGLPVFTLKCTKGPMAGQTFVVTDPGRALISGNCADIGKVKGPILRGLASRAPYFHNGSAATLLDVVNFYDQRFGIGFADQEKQDLVNFLNAL